MALENGHIYEFADFRLIPAEGLLLRNGVPISLTHKAFSTLVLLVEQHGHLVEKSELIERVWENAFVEEAAVSRCVWKIRNALGEDPKKHEFIQTVPKRGYRFVAEVRQINSVNTNPKESAIQLIPEPFSPVRFPGAATGVAGHISTAVVALSEWHRKSENGLEESASGGEPKETDPPPALVAVEDFHTKNRFRIAGFAFGALLIGAVALGYYFFFSGATHVAGKKSVAVLPLKPINTEIRDDIYEVGIADSLIYKLSSMKGLVVRPLSAVRKYKDIEQDPLSAGREQQVDYVLASNYQLAGGKIRVTAQLIKVETGQIEETYKGEKDAANVFSMQDAIAGEVGNILLARFATNSDSLAAKRGTTNEDAYRLYLQGMYFVDKRTVADAQKAVENLEQAVHLDPNYARAWAGKAYAHGAVASFRLNPNIHEDIQKSIEAINKALALDENLSDAHSALCENKMYYEYDFDGAERECRRAIELDPNSSLAHQIYCRYLIIGGRFEEAIAEINTAIDIDPASLFYHRNYGVTLYFARRYTEAAVQLKRVIVMDPNFGNTHFWLLNALKMQGNDSEAFDWFMKSQALRKTDDETIQLFKTAYQTSGWQGVLREQVRQFEVGGTHYSDGAALNAQVGNKDKAFEYLEKAYQRREPWVSMLKVDPRLDSLRDDPRFEELTLRLGF